MGLLQEGVAFKVCIWDEREKQLVKFVTMPSLAGFMLKLTQLTHLAEGKTLKQMNIGLKPVRTLATCYLAYTLG